MNLKKNLFLLLIAVALLVISFKFLPFHCSSKLCLEKSIQTTQTKTVLLKNISISVSIAQTNAERTQGLGGRDGLKENEGMLFVFDKPDTYGFWMKDMKFSIDIVWILGGKIIFIEKSLSPTTYPKVFSPTSPAQFVLELPAGFCDTHEVRVGDSFSVGS
jgi:uncharacterized membrane protein (UPF0127 family)